MTGADAAAILEIEAIPENLFREPIDYIFADHYRLRLVLSALDEFINSGYFERGLSERWRHNLQQIVQFLEGEYLLHLQDEDQDLFPMVRRHASNGGRRVELLRRLLHAHDEDAALARQVTESLRGIIDGRPPERTVEFLRTSLRFVEGQRQHLSWENALLLPLARELLVPEEQEKLGRSMAARRGAAYPERVVSH